MMARESGRSMSELVRDMMDDYLTRTSEEEATRRSVAALDEPAVLRRRVEQEHGALTPSLLDELREQRDTEVAGAAPGWW
jgi:hypothetical protein